MTSVYSPRVQAFRNSILKALPRAPNNKASLQELESRPTRSLILVFVTWRLRLVPAKPRTVEIWTGGVGPFEFMAVKHLLGPLLTKVEAGDDLTPHLSKLVDKKGVVLAGANPSDRGKDIDMVLTREGLHHFHVGLPTIDNPTGRSDILVFAEVLEKAFKIVAISNHGAFRLGSFERLRFFGICSSYMAKDIPPGQAFMANPVMSSGHSLVVTLFADKCEDQIARLDPLLDDSSFIDVLYGDKPMSKDGATIARPPKPALEWHFLDLQFGILDRQSDVFFCIYPFFAR